MEQSFLVVTELMQKTANHPDCMFFWDDESRLGLGPAGICRVVAEAMIRRSIVREVIPHVGGERWVVTLKETAVPELHVTIRACEITKRISVVAVAVVTIVSAISDSAA